MSAHKCIRTHLASWHLFQCLCRSKSMDFFLPVVIAWVSRNMVPANSHYSMLFCHDQHPDRCWLLDYVWPIIRNPESDPNDIHDACSHHTTRLLYVTGTEGSLNADILKYNADILSTTLKLWGKLDELWVESTLFHLFLLYLFILSDKT